MPDTDIQSFMQPFLKLTQANMDAISRFTTAPEVTSAAMDQTQGAVQRGQEAAQRLFQSNAFATLMQGMIRNYMEFLSDVSQKSMSLFSQGQASMVRQAQDATEQASQFTEAQARRVQQAA